MNKKLSKYKYIIAVVCCVLLVIVTLVFAALRWEPEPDPKSEKIIRKAAAKELNKDPNELTDEDFAKILEFNIFAIVYSIF